MTCAARFTPQASWAVHVLFSSNGECDHRGDGAASLAQTHRLIRRTETC